MPSIPEIAIQNEAEEQLAECLEELEKSLPAFSLVLLLHFLL